MTKQHLKYRADIDGLRAIAVLAVIANHLPAKYLPSGFLGVDIFFVISGFVVTASIMGRDGTSLAHFYADFLARRVKRLWPALVAFVSLTALAAWCIDPAPRHTQLTGIASLFGLSNMALMKFELDYFSSLTRLNAFAHTWSLGVEEQFYVAFPFIIWLTYFRPVKHRNWLFPLAIAVASVISLYFFYRYYNSHRSAVYFLMPTRFWELGAGALAYVLTLSRFSTQAMTIAKIAALPALLGLAISLCLPEQLAATSTVLAVAFTVVLLVRPLEIFGSKPFTLPPVVYIGKISYSLYLWHWPLLALGPMILSETWLHPGVSILFMGVASVLSYHFLEKPLRRARWSKSSIREVFIGLFVSIVIAALVFGGTKFRNTGVERFPANYHKLPTTGQSFAKDCIIEKWQRQLNETTFDNCTMPPRVEDGRPRLWVQGDSHAGHLQGLLHQIHQREGLGTHLVETHARPFPQKAAREFPPRAAIDKEIRNRLRPGDIMVVSRLYLTRTNPTGPYYDIRNWSENVIKLSRELDAQGVATVVVGPSPMFQHMNARECMAGRKEACDLPRDKLAQHIDSIVEKLKQMESTGDNLHVFEPFPVLCSPDASTCSPYRGDTMLYRDADHLNIEGSGLLTQPFLLFLRDRDLLKELKPE